MVRIIPTQWTPLHGSGSEGSLFPRSASFVSRHLVALARPQFSAHDFLSRTLGVPPEFFDNHFSPTFYEGGGRELLAAFGEEGIRQLRALAQDPSPEMFFEGLLHFAQHQIEIGHVEGTARLYSAVANAPEDWGVPSEFRLRARHAMDVLRGGGTFGESAEVFLRSLPQTILDPENLTAMGTAQGVYRATSALAASFLLGSRLRWLSGGWGARLTSAAVGTLFEIPAFTLSGRLMRSALGRPVNWEGGALGQDLSSAALVLGSLKMTGGAGNLFTSRLLGEEMAVATSSPMLRFTRRFFPQATMYAGILLGHGLETSFGLREARNGSQLLLDSLFTLAHFNLSGQALGMLLPRGFQSWERELQLRTDALMRGQEARLFQNFRLPPPGLGQPLALADGTPSAFEDLLPTGRETVLAMVESGPKDKASGRTNTELLPATREAPKIVTPETLGPARAKRWLSTKDAEGRTQFFPYELLLEDFSLWNQVGATRSIARREGREITLKLLASEWTQETNPYVRRGLPDLTFEIGEDGKAGVARLFLEEQTVNLLSIKTREEPYDLPPGAASIFMDWLATQTARMQKNFKILRIDSPQIYRILERGQLLDPRQAWLEGCYWDEAGPSYSVEYTGELGDKDFFNAIQHSHFINVRGKPNPRLLPASLRTFVEERDFSTTRSDQASHPFNLHLEPLANFLELGRTNTIAVRAEGELRATVKKIDRSGWGIGLLPRETVNVHIDLEEAGKTGFAKFYVGPNELTLFDVNTENMNPGLGTIMMEWLASQAAIRDSRFTVEFIKNRKVVEILRDRALLQPGTDRLELLDWDNILAAGQLKDADNLIGRYGFLNMMATGRPNPALLPNALRYVRVPRLIVSQAREGIVPTYPYHLWIEPLERLQTGSHTVLGTHEGRQVVARVRHSGPPLQGERFFSPQSHQVDIELQEGESRGRMTFYLEKGVIHFTNLETTVGPRPMPAGVGTMALDWLTTQAALTGRDMHFMNIKNPHVIDILRRNALIDETSAKVESGFWDFAYSSFVHEESGNFTDHVFMRKILDNHYRMQPVYQIYAKPNPSLMTDELRKNFPP